MKAMMLEQISRLDENPSPLQLREIAAPAPGRDEILVKVAACGVCHTELDEIEGRTPPPRLPVIPGHQVIGHVVARGKNAHRFKEGERVGVAWIFSACGKCKFCTAGKENLCAEFRATGRDANGGYAEYMTIQQDFAFPIPRLFSDIEAAPLLCAGAIGYRTLQLSGLQDGQSLGLTGFGASGHLVLKMAQQRFPRCSIFVFARSDTERAFARELGAAWVGDSEATAPEMLDAIIDTTPVWKPVLTALHNLAPGGRLVINAIRKEDIDKEALLGLDYPSHLWMDKEIKSTANVTRGDVQEFLLLAEEMSLKPEVACYSLNNANQALLDLKRRKIRGAKVLRITDK